MKPWILILGIIMLSAGCERDYSRSGRTNEGKAAQSAAGGSADEGKAARSAAGR
jgi:hypothetical protein